MNTYRGSTIGAPSKATASTLCQKCLKRGHYSYECKAVAQERPYVSRPSRTQQLFNPKLVPKLTNDIPQDISGSKGKPDQPKQLDGDRGRKRDRDSNDTERPRKIKRPRSTSSRSSISASTISTNASRSPRRGEGRDRVQRSRRKSSTVFQDNEAPPLQSQNERSNRSYQNRIDPAHSIGRGRQPSRSWSRGSCSPVSPSRSRSPRRDGLKNTSRRNRERFRSRSRTPPREHRGYSRRPDDGRDELARDRGRAEHSDTVNRWDPGQTREVDGRNGTRSYRERETVPAPHVRSRSRSPIRTRVERSLSPFSQRVALTRAMNAGR